MRRAILVIGLVLACVVAGTVDRSSADTPDFQVIVHPDNPATTVSAALLRSAYLKREGAWPDGSRLRPIDLSNRFPVRAVFSERVLEKSVETLRRYWNQRIFSGKGTPPPQFDTTHAAIREVLSDRSCVGYLPATADPGDAKVIAVRW